MLKVKDIKLGQMFYAMDDNGEPYAFNASTNPDMVNGVWEVKAVWQIGKEQGTRDYCYTFEEKDECILFPTDSLI